MALEMILQGARSLVLVDCSASISLSLRHHRPLDEGSLIVNGVIIHKVVDIPLGIHRVCGRLRPIF
jgi:hypothetical protein